MLRTTFHLLSGMTLPVQVVGERCEVVLREHDLEELVAGAWEEAVEDMLAEDREIAFDLVGGPMLRAGLVGLGPDRRALILSMPAIAADSASLRNLAEEIAADYAGKNVEGDEEVLQYADAAEILHEWLKAAQDDPDSFWRRQDLNALAREGRTAGLEAPYGPRAVRAVMTGGRLERLASLARQLDVSMPQLLLALWQATIYPSKGEGRVVVGVAFDGRTCV